MRPSISITNHAGGSITIHRGATLLATITDRDSISDTLRKHDVTPDTRVNVAFPSGKSDQCTAQAFFNGGTIA